ncbi:MAG: hypothetical protein Q7T18_03330 [Sedimentisphaerales bacterium]|nr:hypothetical protein [Sedimentisphaerales bacterium]
MDVRELVVSTTAIKQGWFNLRRCGKDFFPADAFGKSKKTSPGKQLLLHIKELQDISTDLPTDENEKPRWFLALS